MSEAFETLQAARELDELFRKLSWVSGSHRLTPEDVRLLARGERLRVRRVADALYHLIAAGMTVENAVAFVKQERAFVKAGLVGNAVHIAGFDRIAQWRPVTCATATSEERNEP